MTLIFILQGAEKEIIYFIFVTDVFSDVFCNFSLLICSSCVTNLEWTTTKNDLIELVYALQQIKAIYYGKMSINKIIAVFGKIFNIDLKR
ncbi:RteC domain-containing protein [Capnocytophaga canimorsus]|uniref:RteC domain-containing protein n=1 Tax=Capnocytophaga canimorsus TaxID=28188 RepID=UPI0020865B49|nr:RteC domain-containing protein [Capnocytophaga canimorsus]GJQ05072.1 hypothetical protein CAPN009_14870 [Capnocytophaga canimorsus]